MNEKFFENVLSHLEQAVFVLDRNGNIVYVNECFVRNSLFTKSEVLSSSCDQLFQSGRIDMNIYQMVREQKQAVTALEHIHNPAKAGDGVTYLVTQSPIMDAHGEVEWIIGVIRDVDTIQEMVRSARRSIDHIYRPGFANSADSDRRTARPVYRSACMERLLHTADIVAASNATVLLLGESGTGKEVLANYIHRSGPRSGEEMVAINCAALNETLLESELFGYEKGAFTGALNSGKKGLIETANNGTLFLDEVDSLPISLQAKLLRVLETHEVRPLGGCRDIKVDFRVIAATNADLEARVAEHAFREDLYYRLNVLPLTIPPLRERREDIAPLTSHFLDSIRQKYSRDISISPLAMDKLKRYSWPGNVRELRNFVERLVLMSDFSVTEIKDIPDEMFSSQAGQTTHSRAPSIVLDAEPPLSVQTEVFEAEVIERALSRYGSLPKAAEALGISRSTLIRKRRR